MMNLGVLGSLGCQQPREPNKAPQKTRLVDEDDLDSHGEDEDYSMMMTMTEMTRRRIMQIMPL